MLKSNEISSILRFLRRLKTAPWASTTVWHFTRSSLTVLVEANGAIQSAYTRTRDKAVFTAVVGYTCKNNTTCSTTSRNTADKSTCDIVSLVTNSHCYCYCYCYCYIYIYIYINFYYYNLITNYYCDILLLKYNRQ